MAGLIITEVAMAPPTGEGVLDLSFLTGTRARHQPERFGEVLTRKCRNACFALRYMELAIGMDESWHCVAGAADCFAATVTLRVGLRATGELFIALTKVTRRVKPCSRAALLAGEASGASPARMKPWPAPS